VQAGETKPAYYAAGAGRWRDWWTLLHPPYTARHLSYVVIGAALAPQVLASNMIATVLAFFLAVGLAAHALDELRGRPLRTAIPSGVLVAVVVAGLLGALVLGVFGVIRVGWTLIPFMVAGPVLVIAYNAELFGGLMHTDFGFALAWGAFPVLTAYVAQTGTLALAPVWPRPGRTRCRGAAPAEHPAGNIRGARTGWRTSMRRRADRAAHRRHPAAAAGRRCARFLGLILLAAALRGTPDVTHGCRPRSLRHRGRWIVGYFQ
jgi:hypothetical protein